MYILEGSKNMRKPTIKGGKMRKNLWKMCVVQFGNKALLCAQFSYLLMHKEIPQNSILKQGFLLLAILESTGQIF